MYKTYSLLRRANACVIAWSADWHAKNPKKEMPSYVECDPENLSLILDTTLYQNVL